MGTPAPAEHSGPHRVSVCPAPAPFTDMVDHVDCVHRPQHDEDVMQMNEAHDQASGAVQRAPPRVVGMIDKPGHSDRSTS
jgi:hypothetical protein